MERAGAYWHRSGQPVSWLQTTAVAGGAITAAFRWSELGAPETQAGAHSSRITADTSSR